MEGSGSGSMSSRAIAMSIAGEFVATIVFLVWVLFISKTTSFGEGDTYGWSAWLKNIPANIVMLIPPIMGLVWGRRALRQRETNASVAVVISGLSLFWALLITHYVGLVSAFGDAPDWSGFWLFLGKVVCAAVVTVLVWRNGRTATHTSVKH